MQRVPPRTERGPIRRRLEQAIPSPSRPLPTGAKATPRTDAPTDLLTPQAAQLLDAASIHSSNPAAARNLIAHAKELGVAADGEALKNIQRAELLKGQGRDVRVSARDQQDFIERSLRASRMQPSLQADLFGFTRLVDAKLVLTPALLETLVAGVSDRGALLAAIDAGPGKGGVVWSSPATPEELVASMVRQLALGDGASRQISIHPTLEAWLREVLAAAEQQPQLAMGGAGTFCANLAGTQPALTPSFLSRDAMPENIVQRMGPRVRLVDGQGGTHAATDHQTTAKKARVNFATEYAATPFSVGGAAQVLINGLPTRLQPAEPGRMILGTQGDDVVPGFNGISDEALARMGREHDLFFHVGAHYLTRGTQGEANAAATEMARGLSVMKQANPKLVRHLQYVSPKVPANEATVLAALRGQVDSVSLNAVELAPLLDALHDAGMTSFDVPATVPREAAEDPTHMLSGAMALSAALDAPRVHLHGLEGDLIVARAGAAGADDADRQVLACLRARQMAANKAANASGEIVSANDLWDVVPGVRGTGLAALHRFADAVQARFDLSDSEREHVVRRGWYRDLDGTTLLFVPSHGIHDRTGGTVSLGDTIDFVSLSFALKGTRPPVLKHPAFFDAP